MLQLLVLFLVLSFESTAKPVTAEDEVLDALAHAQALYDEARFKESVDLLLRVEELLLTKPDLLDEKISVKLHLALAHIGMNENAKAKASLGELFALDADYRMDRDQFSPKVLAMADEAQAEQNEVRCQTVRSDAQKHLESQKPTVLLDYIGMMKSKCPALQQLEPGLADLFYKSGLERYKRGEFPEALQDFRNAITLSPKHELAAQYVDLTQNKLQVLAGGLFLDWRKHFDARESDLAAADYRRMVAYANSDTTSMLEDMRAEYRKALSGFVNSWKQACAKGDKTMTEGIAREASAMLPETSLGEGLLDQMKTCTHTSCLEMNSTLAMARLKKRVNPTFPAILNNWRIPITVRVQARIDENGVVTVGGAEGGNPMVQDAVRTAVAQWEFVPILDEAGPRCVNTEIPIVIRP
jgi:hypothetical protein